MFAKIARTNTMRLNNLQTNYVEIFSKSKKISKRDQKSSKDVQQFGKKHIKGVQKCTKLCAEPKN